MYQKIIREELAKNGYIGKYDPRHIEGYMRLQYSTLDHLSISDFRREIKICRQCIDVGGITAAEENAVSFGL